MMHDNILSKEHAGTELFHLYANAEGEVLVSPFPLEEDGGLLARQIEWLRGNLPQFGGQSVWAKAGNRGICPEFFLYEMSYRWGVELGNIVTGKLRTLWHSH